MNNRRLTATEIARESKLYFERQNKDFDKAMRAMQNKSVVPLIKKLESLLAKYIN